MGEDSLTGRSIHSTRTDSLQRLVEPSSPLPSQLPDSLYSMLSPDFPASKRRSVGPGATFGQMLARDSLSLMGWSESPCSHRSSQPDFTARMRASIAAQPDSQFDSQAKFDDEEDREERRHQQEEEADETLKIVETQNSQRSSQQKKDKEPIKSKAKTKPSSLPTLQKEPVEVDSLSEEEVEVI